VASFGSSITITCKSVMVSFWYAYAYQTKHAAQESMALFLKTIGHHLVHTATPIITVVIIVIITMQSTCLSVASYLARRYSFDQYQDYSS